MTHNRIHGGASQQGMLSLGLVLALFGLAHYWTPLGPPAAHGGGSGGYSQIRGIPAPHQMIRIGEDETLVVPDQRKFVLTGIVTTENWSDASPVVVRFNGQVVFKRGMYPGEVITLPPGIAADSGSTVEIDRLSLARDSRVTLLGYMSGGR